MPKINAHPALFSNRKVEMSQFAPPEDIPDHLLWTPKAVLARLIEAGRVSELTGGRVAPAAMRSVMPAFAADDDDLKDAMPGRPTISATQRQMTRVEEAMLWPWTYLEGFDGYRRCLRLFVWCKVKRVPFNQALKRKGWARATAFRARDRALIIIAFRLNQDRIPLQHANTEGDENE